MNNRKLLSAIVPFLGAIPCSVLAQDESPAGAENPAPERTDEPSKAVYSFEAGASYMFNAGMDDASGEANMTRVGADFNAVFFHGKKWSTSFDATTRFSVYNFEGNLTGFTPGGGEPFDNLYAAGVTLGANYAHDDHWIYSGALRVSTGFADGGEVSESLTYGGFAGFSYVFKPNVRLGVAVVASTRLDDEFTVFPVPLVEADFDLTDRLRLDISTIDGVRLGYEVSDTFEVGLGVDYEYTEYRLGNSGPAPGGVFRESYVPLLLEGVYQPNPDLTLSLGVSTLLYGQYELDDSNGLSLGDTNVREDLTFHFALRYSW